MGKRLDCNLCAMHLWAESRGVAGSNLQVKTHTLVWRGEGWKRVKNASGGIEEAKGHVSCGQLDPGVWRLGER